MAEQVSNNRLHPIEIEDSPPLRSPNHNPFRPNGSIEIIGTIPRSFPTLPRSFSASPSYSGIGPRPTMPTHNTRSKRKRRHHRIRQQPLTLTPIHSSTKTRSKTQRQSLSKTLPKTYVSARKRKRSNDDQTQSAKRLRRNVSSLTDCNAPNATPSRKVRSAHRNQSGPIPRRKSSRLQHRERIRKGKVNKPMEMIDLSSDRDEEVIPDPIEQGSNQMDVDAEDDDVDLVQTNFGEDSVSSTSTSTSTTNQAPLASDAIPIDLSGCNDSNSSNTSNASSIDNDTNDHHQSHRGRSCSAIDLISRGNSVEKSDSTDSVTSVQAIDDSMDVDIDEIDIDLTDTEIPAIGIAIGTHQDFWNCSEFVERPKVLINKHSNSIDLYLRSHLDEFVTVSIKTSEIESLFLPTNPSFFEINELRSVSPARCDVVEEDHGHVVTAHIQTVFIQTKGPLTAYRWLSDCYDPNDLRKPGVQQITLFLGREGYDSMKKLVLNRVYFCAVTGAVQQIDDSEKKMRCDNIKLKRTMLRKWQKYDGDKTNEHICRLLLPDASHHDSTDTEHMNDDGVSNGHPHSALGIDIEPEEAPCFEVCCVDPTFHVYEPNDQPLLAPHHEGSKNYAMTRTSKPEPSLECYWVMPQQHGHRQYVATIHSKDYTKTVHEDYLNDTIIDFQLHYIYASWPCAFKEDVYIFNSFFWKKLIKLRSKKPTANDKKQVLKWTRRYTKLFEKRYMIIPKCSHEHWELIIIAYAGTVVKQWLRDYRKQHGAEKKSDEESETGDIETETPCIAMLDSLNGKAKSIDLRLIRKWLDLQATQYIDNVLKEDKMESEGDADDEGEYEVFTAKSISGYCVNVPEQPNGHDCGCFLLRNVVQFGKEGGFKDTSSKKAMDLRNWYHPVEEGVEYRKQIAYTIAQLISEQKAIHLKVKDHFQSKEREFIKEQYKLRMAERSKSVSP